MTAFFKKYKSLLSLEVMMVALVFLALSCAVATFIENDYGPIGSKSFIYGQTWFEAILTLLTLGIIANIFIFKMYQTKKFFILLIHSSLVFIFIGAALTRYYGYEAIMTIPENSMQNRAFSTDTYIQAKLFKKDQLLDEYNKKIIMTPLSQTDFSHQFYIDKKPLHIAFHKFVPNAKEGIISTQKGPNIINVIVMNLQGKKSFDLIKAQQQQEGDILFSLNQPVTQTTPYIYFFEKNNQLYLKSNLEVHTSTMQGKRSSSIKPNEEKPLQKNHVYKIKQTTFVTPEFSVHGKIDVIQTGEFRQKDALHAVITSVAYKDSLKKVALFSTGENKGYIKRIDIDDYTLELHWGVKEITLPFSIFLQNFTLERYPGSNSPSSYSSDIKLYDSKNNVNEEHIISMNNTLDYQGYRFFQSSYTTDEQATILSINKDPGKVPTYIGYFILFTGLIMSLFSKNGRFYKLASKKYTLGLLPVLLVLSLNYDVNAQELNKEQLAMITNINEAHAKHLGSMLIQDYQGRIKPLNSLSVEIMNKVIRTNSFKNLNANQLFLSMTLYPRVWQQVDFVAVKNPEVKALLGIPSSQKYFSFEDIYTQFGTYKLQEALETAHAKKSALRSKFDNEIIKIDERLNIAYKVFNGGFLTLFPKVGDKNNKWLAANIVLSSFNTTSVLEKEKEEIYQLITNYFSQFENPSTIDWTKATLALEQITLYQKKHASHVMPSSFHIKTELLFNQFNIFDRLTFVYLILGLLLLTAIFVKIFKNSTNLKTLTTIVLSLLMVCFVIHTFGLALRWYIAGHAPWSNGYESMIYISWAIILSGVLFARQSTLALSNTAILSGITLFVAHLSWLEPQITTLVPVLKSYWLTIHVSVITASYGFLALSALLGVIMLILFILINPNNSHFNSVTIAIKESRRINEMSMMIGLVLLVIGNFLGAIWANESWGRYWGWDPKETWTLISIIIYVLILHLHYVKGLATHYIFAVLSLISYASIVMTYFGVNYYLAGKHSYAAGDPIPIPTFVPITALIIFILIALSYKNRNALSTNSSQ